MDGSGPKVKHGPFLSQIDSVNHLQPPVTCTFIIPLSNLRNNDRIMQA